MYSTGCSVGHKALTFAAQRGATMTAEGDPHRFPTSNLAVQLSGQPGQLVEPTEVHLRVLKATTPLSVAVSAFGAARPDHPKCRCVKLDPGSRSATADVTQVGLRHEAEAAVAAVHDAVVGRVDVDHHIAIWPGDPVRHVLVLDEVTTRQGSRISSEGRTSPHAADISGRSPP